MQSCGCVPKNEKHFFDYSGEKYGVENSDLEFRSYIHDMNTDFAAVTKPEELFYAAKQSAEYFKLKKLFICLCSNIERDTNKLDKDNLISDFKGISDTMVNMFSFGSDVPIEYNFLHHSLFPRIF